MLEQDKLIAFSSAAGKFYLGLREACDRYEIDTPQRIAAFMAQIAHESAGFRYVRELASGEAYDTGRLALRLGNTPEDDDDGRRYKGRGLIQITGTDNYRAVGNALLVDFLKNPEKLEEPRYAALSAGWYWDSRELNKLADRGMFKEITRKINGGLNGYQDRLRWWDKAKKVWGVK